VRPPVGTEQPQRGQGQLVGAGLPGDDGVADDPATGAPPHPGIGERLDGFRRFELAGPDLPAVADRECPLEPDGVADRGRWRTRRPRRVLSRSPTPRAHDAQEREGECQRSALGDVASWRRASSHHRFSRRARSAKARRSSTPYGTLVWSATWSTPAWTSFRVRSWNWRSAATLTRVRVGPWLVSSRTR